ncbi:MAG: PorV/PorQ family protein [candidate division WOR-3 bacterium]
MKKYFLAILFFEILYASGGEFLNIYPDARGSAMNSLFSLSEGVEGIYWNPANISKGKYPEIIMTHSEWFFNTRYDYFGISFYREKVGNLGFSLMGFYSTGIELRNDTVPTYEEYSILYSNSTISYSRKFKNLFWGTNLKVIYGSIYKSSAFSFAGDVGVNYSFKFFNFALTLKNIGLPLKFEKKKDPLPSQIGGGIGFSTYSKNLNFEIGGFYNFPDKWWGIGIGGEYLLWNFFSLRLGYSTNISNIPEEMGITYGAGVKFFGFNFDYSFIPYGILGETHRFTLKYNFETIQRKKGEIEEILKIKAREELKKKEKMVAENYIISGKEKMDRGELEEAKKDFDIALIWDPENEEARKLYILVESRIITKKVTDCFLNARKCMKAGDYSKSLFYIQEILKIDPENPDARSLADSVELFIKKKTESKFLKKETKDYFETGLKFFKKGEYAKAKNYFSKILEIEPENLQAKEYYNECERKIEEIYSFYFKKGKNLYENKKYVEAKGILEKALTYKITQEINELLKEIKENLKKLAEENYQKGVQFFNKGEIEDAYFYFIKARVCEPADPRINSYIQKIEREYKDKIDEDEIYLRGIEAYVENDFQTAIDCWLKVKEINPDYPNIDKNIQRAKSKIEELKKG